MRCGRLATMLNKKIYTIDVAKCEYVLQRMVHAEPFVEECQHATAENAWSCREAHWQAFGVKLDRSSWVAVTYIGTGTKNERGIELFAPDWAATFGLSE
jgi:hypothetical protein